MGWREQEVAITKKNLDTPDQTYTFGDAGSYDISIIGDSMAARSVMRPGWSWDEHVKPYAEGAQSCPELHHEYVISGQIRYLTDEGDEVIAGPGDHLVIEPGHRAWVIGDEPCVTLDMEIGEMEDEEDHEGHDHD
jgi:mannose-6-phosphate isomerase-like protein (cupin superfamily)